MAGAASRTAYGMAGLFAGAFGITFVPFDKVIRETQEVPTAYPKAKPALVRPDDEEFRLVHAQVVFRHGARTTLAPPLPEHDIEWDVCEGAREGYTVPIEVQSLDGGPRPRPLFEEKQRRRTLPGGAFPGQLTALGCQQAIELGGRLRRRYIEELRLLPHRYHPKDVYVRSTNLNRTIETAQGVLCGMYPGNNKGKSAIPIYVAEDQKEWLHPNSLGCPRLEGVFAAAEARWGADPDVRHVHEKARMILGVENLPHDMIGLRDTIVAMTSHGLGLPQSLIDNANILQEIEELAIWQINTFFCGLDGKPDLLSVQLSVAKFIQDIVEAMDKMVQKQPDVRKLYLWSAHDTTLLSILNALRIFDNRWPPYASSFAFEVLEKHKRRKHQQRQNEDAPTPSQSTSSSTPSSAPTPGNTAASTSSNSPHMGGTSSALHTPSESAGFHSSSADNARDSASNPPQYYVRIMYNGREMPLPGCDGQTPCPIDKFRLSLKPFLEFDVSKECTVTIAHANSNEAECKPCQQQQEQAANKK